MKTPKILGVAFVLAQNLKRIADWSERPPRCLALSAATNVMLLFFLLLLIYSYVFIQFDLIQV